MLFDQVLNFLAMGEIIEQVDDFFVFGLAKIGIPTADRDKILGSEAADHFIHFTLELCAGFGSADRDGDNDFTRMQLLERRDRGTHAGTGGEPVVDEDDDLVFEI